MIQPKSDRWRIQPSFDDDGMHIVIVRTARGTGRVAASCSFISDKLLTNRKLVADAVWQARGQAMSWRERKMATSTPRIRGANWRKRKPSA